MFCRVANGRRTNGRLVEYVIGCAIVIESKTGITRLCIVSLMMSDHDIHAARTSRGRTDTGSWTKDHFDIIRSIGRSGCADSVVGVRGRVVHRHVVHQQVGVGGCVEDVRTRVAALEVVSPRDVVRAISGRHEVVDVARAEWIVSRCGRNDNIVPKYIGGTRRARKGCTVERCDRFRAKC